MNDLDPPQSAESDGRTIARDLSVLQSDVDGRPASVVLAEIARALEAASEVWMTAHIRPDGDAFGSEVALALGLQALGKTVRVFNDTAPPGAFRGLLPAGLVEVIDPAQSVAGGSGAASAAGIDAASATADTCVLLDTSEVERAGPMAPLFRESRFVRIVIDHHLVRGAYPYDHHLVVQQAPATGCLVLALLDELGVTIDRAVATALWLAITSDTGWFRFANTTPFALHCAARLVECGLEPEKLFAQIYGSYRIARTRAVGDLLQGIEEELDGRLVLTVIRPSLLGEHGVQLDELDGVIDHLKSIRGAEVVAVITEIDTKRYKISLRAVRDVSVEAIARDFQGGGHAKAAGCRFEGTLEQLRKALAERVLAELP